MFLEKTIQSVLSQGYPNLEYAIIDGGSKDDSVEIIHRYESQLNYWCSEQDGGQYDAVNKGFARSTGEIMAWLNSDDMYFPWTFRAVAEIFSKFPEVEWISTLYPSTWNPDGVLASLRVRKGFSQELFFKGVYMRSDRYRDDYIQQESTFWRRSLWEKAGGRLSSEYKLGADFELWARFFRHARLYGVRAVLGGFRYHGHQRSIEERTAYLSDCEAILKAYGGKHCSWLESKLRSAGWPLKWPFCHMPSLGFMYQGTNIIYDFKQQSWILVPIYVA